MSQRLSGKHVALLAALAVAVLTLTPGQPLEASCALRQDTGVLCDTVCTNMGGGLTCFDEDEDRCCYESENACGDTTACSECQGPSCMPGGF